MLLDDPSPLVRRALAEVFAGSDACAADRRACARQRSAGCRVADPASARRCWSMPIWSMRSPSGEPERQIAIAGRARSAVLGLGGDRRSRLRRSLPGAAGKRATPKSCRSRSTASSQRFGHLAAIRDVLLARDDLPAPTRQALVVKLSETLADFVTARDMAGRGSRPAHHQGSLREGDRRRSPPSRADDEVRPLIRHLRESGQLTAGLILRALLSGNVALFEEALADLAELPLPRVVGIVHDRRGAGFRALYDKAGLPAVDLSRRSARRSRRCARTASWASRAARAGSSAASSSAC